VSTRDPRWGGWSLDRGALVRSHGHLPHTIDQVRFVTAADAIDALASLVRGGATDECLAGLVRVYVDLRRGDKKKPT
jgi:hypothetical protein